MFSAYTPDRGIELWQSDGTSFGTRLVADVNTGPSSSGPTNVQRIGSHVIFSADDGTPLGREFWTTTLAVACRCDVDNSGATGIQDLFNYLSMYFTGAGDFNGDGQNTVVDVFDFLGCWFAGCE
jgi:ELWxxDGT repeat protein